MTTHTLTIHLDHLVITFDEDEDYEGTRDELDDEVYAAVVDVIENDCTPDGTGWVVTDVVVHTGPADEGGNQR
jgi:hypothetical protein